MRHDSSGAVSDEDIRCVTSANWTMNWCLDNWIPATRIQCKNENGKTQTNVNCNRKGVLTGRLEC